MAQGSLLPHEDTRSQLAKFNFTKPLMFHKVLQSKSGAATENRVTRPLCKTWRQHPVGSSGQRFTTPPSHPAARRPQRTKVQRGQASSIAAPLFRGRSTGQRGGGDAHAEHTETSETHNSQHVPPLAALSLQPPMPHRPPHNPTASQASRDLYLAALQHISSNLGPTVPTANSRRTGLI